MFRRHARETYQAGVAIETGADLTLLENLTKRCRQYGAQGSALRMCS